MWYVYHKIRIVIREEYSMTSDTVSRQVALLTAQDQAAGYEAMHALLRESARGCHVYSHMEHFFELLECKSSYLRTRGALLIAANARWDERHLLDRRIDRYLSHILDPKPITARQCIKALPGICACKPALKNAIVAALEEADTSCYRDSMRPLIEKDIRSALSAIQNGPSTVEQEQIKP